MIIAISQRIDFISNRNEHRDAVDQNLIRLIDDLGHTPIQVPNVLFAKNKNQKLDEWLIKLNPGGLILSGGNDIGEFENRDATEEFLYIWAKKKQKTNFRYMQRNANDRYYK